MEYGAIIVLLLAYIGDWLFADPRGLPHLIVGYGRIISAAENWLNNGRYTLIKGAGLSIGCIGLAFYLPMLGLRELQQLELYQHQLYPLELGISALLLFYCLANRGLIDAGRKVFSVLEHQGLDAGRAQVGQIVGRDTNQLDHNQVKAAALETMAENLSDGVIAPLFYFALLGVPGAMAYKMINTLDSMIGYRNPRYEQFGKVAARLDDMANFIPARITALLMLISQAKLGGLAFVYREAGKHKSPNAGYPEAALAYILNCQFGGPSSYQGVHQNKAVIGRHKRDFVMRDIVIASRVNAVTSLLSVAIISGVFYCSQYWL